MRLDYDQIKNEFQSITPMLIEIASKIEENLTEVFEGVEHIDRITCRVKGEESFMAKTLKEEDGKLKYETPIKEIQDQVGARIVIYYKNDTDKVVSIIKQYYQFVEERNVIPEDVMKFGYEGLHFVCFIPSPIYSDHKQNLLIPDFFELQIKTLYQHAWSQSEHGLGYKPGTPLSYDDERKLAFIAAQSWGADKILEEMISNRT